MPCSVPHVATRHAPLLTSPHRLPVTGAVCACPPCIALQWGDCEMVAVFGKVKKQKAPRAAGETAELRQMESLEVWAASLKAKQLAAAGRDRSRGSTDWRCSRGRRTRWPRTRSSTQTPSAWAISWSRRSGSGSSNASARARPTPATSSFSCCSGSPAAPHQLCLYCAGRGPRGVDHAFPRVPLERAHTLVLRGDWLRLPLLLQSRLRDFSLLLFHPLTHRSPRPRSETPLPSALLSLLLSPLCVTPLSSRHNLAPRVYRAPLSQGFLL